VSIRNEALSAEMTMAALGRLLNRVHEVVRDVDLLERARQGGRLLDIELRGIDTRPALLELARAATRHADLAAVREEALHEAGPDRA
jgi:hypothetical protein